MHVRRSLALALAVPLLLAGCTDEPTPKIPEPTTPSPTSPSPSESESPEQESAEDFIRRWQAASDEMQRTGETTDYLALSPKCAPCKSLAQNVDNIYAGGGRIEFKGSRVTRLEATGNKPPTFDVDLRLSKTVIRRASGGPETLPAGTMTIRVTLDQAGDQYTVTHYGVL